MKRGAITIAFLMLLGACSLLESDHSAPARSVEGWAVLAQKDDYQDVNMTDLPVDYAGLLQIRDALVNAGWQADHILELREFDREDLRDGVSWLAERADEDDIVLVYVASHGRYLQDVLDWRAFFPEDWRTISSERRLLILDTCQAAKYAAALNQDPDPYVSLAAVDADEFGWSGLEEEGLPIIGGVFTHYLAAALGDERADMDGDSYVSIQEAAEQAEAQQRTYMHEVVFAVPEFLGQFTALGGEPHNDPTYPDVIVVDRLGEPLILDLDAYHEGQEGEQGAVRGAHEPTETVDLAELDFDAFLDLSYQQLLQRDPELVTELGLSDELGTGNVRLTDISYDYVVETQRLESKILELLDQFDPSQLGSGQQLSADIYRWYLADRVVGHQYHLYSYPVNQMLDGVQNGIIHFFSEIVPVRDRREAVDYITRLGQLELKFDQLLDNLRRCQETGVVLPSYLIEWVLSDVQSIVNSPAQELPFYTTFADRLDGLSELDDTARLDLLKRAEREIEVHVIPAYEALEVVLRSQLPEATEDHGVWKFPQGEEYYAHVLRHYTTTDLTPDQVHQMGIAEVERIQLDIRAQAKALGYPADLSMPALYGRLAQDGGILVGESVKNTYEGLIQGVQAELPNAFEVLPATPVIVKGDRIGGYYVPPAEDGSRPGAFYAQLGAEGVAYLGMPTLTFHETVPGHHLQIALAQEMDLPALRSRPLFTAYVEGWALYAERLAWEIGMYEDDPFGNLGRLQAELFRAARLVVDTGIHAMGWSRDQAFDYMVETVGRPQEAMFWEVSRYIVRPGQATAYMIGMLKILELRQMAMDALGERFDLRSFHTAVLGHGAVPLEVLEGLVEQYISDEL